MRWRRLHRLLGLIIFVPSFVWGLSGAFLAWKNFAQGGPEPPTAAVVKRPFRIAPAQALVVAESTRAPNQATAEHPRSIEWVHLTGSPYYLVRYESPPAVVLINGETAELLPRIDEALARSIATEAAPLGTRVVGCELQQKPSLVFLRRQELPVYRVALSDQSDVYVSSTTGEVFFRATRIFWVIRFAFYGLHVWKWSQEPGRNGSFLVLLVMGLLLSTSSLTGLGLIFRTSRRRAAA